MISEPHSRPLQTGLTSVKLAWRAVCVPIYTVLVILEPFVGFFLSANTPLYEVRSTGHNVPHPSKESRAGVLAAVNAACNVAAEQEGSCE